MKRTYFLLLAFMLAMTVVKAQNNQAAIQMNDKMALVTDSLYSGGQRWGNEFNKCFTSGNYSTLKPLCDQLLIYIDTKKVEVEKMKDVNNSKPLRMALIELLVFEKRMIAEGFRPFEVFDASTSKEKVQAALDNLKEKSKDEDVYVQKVATAQKTYAGENGFKIE